MREIWALQPRLARRSARYAYALLEHPRFRAAYDFLLLRARTGEAPQEFAQWWEEFQDADEARRAELIELAARGVPADAPKKRRRRRRKPTSDGADGAPGETSPAETSPPES
jgi:poly(A) polymerase